jgi:hypothetical protein
VDSSSNGAGAGSLLVLVVLRLVEGSVKHDRVGIESLILTALISLAIFEPIGRSTFIILKYLKNENAQSSSMPENRR